MHEIVHKHILEKGIYNDFFLMDKIQGILKEERILDGPPKPIKLERAKTEYMGGIRSNFKKTFENIMVTEGIPCTLSIQGLTIHMDAPVYKALKTLLMVGVSKDPDIADTCRRVFLSIVSKSGTSITTEQMLAKIPHDTYLANQIALAIQEVVK